MIKNAIEERFRSVQVCVYKSLPLGVLRLFFIIANTFNLLQNHQQRKHVGCAPAFLKKKVLFTAMWSLQAIPASIQIGTLLDDVFVSERDASHFQNMVRKRHAGSPP